MLVVSVHGMSMAFSNRCHVRKGTFGLRKALSLGGFMEHRRLGLAVYMTHLAGQLQSLSQVPERRKKPREYPLVMTNIAIENDHL